MSPGSDFSQQDMWFFPARGEWTRADYFSLPRTQHIVELVDGELKIAPPPDMLHQRVVHNMAEHMRAAARVGRRGKIIVGPICVCFTEDSCIRQPDILFLRRRSKAAVENMCVEGIPDLIVEVVSPDTYTWDTEEKIETYATFGVAEYWCVDPLKQFIQVYHLRDGRYHLLAEAHKDQAAASETLTGLLVAPADLIPD